MTDLNTLIKLIDAMRDDVDMGKRPDDYDLSKWLDLLAIDLLEQQRDRANYEQDMTDELRLAYGYQETYLEQLEHAEQHIEWLQTEFADDIVECDKYERAC